MGARHIELDRAAGADDPAVAQVCMDREGRRRLLPLRRRLEVPKHRGDRGEDVRLSGVGLADQDVEGPGSQRRLPKGAKPEAVQARDPLAWGARTGVTLNTRHEVKPRQRTKAGPGNTM